MSRVDLSQYYPELKLNNPSASTLELPDTSLPTVESKLKQMINAANFLKSFKLQQPQILAEQPPAVIEPQQPQLTAMPTKTNWNPGTSKLATVVAAFGKYLEDRNNLKAEQERLAYDQYNKEQAEQKAAEKLAADRQYAEQWEASKDERENKQRRENFDYEMNARQNSPDAILDREYKKALIARASERSGGSGGSGGRQSNANGQMTEHDKIQYAKMDQAQQKQEYNNYIDLLKFKKTIENKKAQEVMDPTKLPEALAGDADYQQINELMLNNGYYQKLQQDKQAKETVKEGVRSLNNVINTFKNYFGNNQSQANDISLEEIKRRRKANAQQNYAPNYNTGGGQGLGENYQ